MYRDISSNESLLLSLTRRGFLVQTSAALAGSILISDASAAPLTGNVEDTLVFADTNLISTIRETNYPEQNFTKQILDNFLSRTEQGGIEPHLAKSYKVSDDGLEYTLELRKDATFSDGSPFDAKIAKRNLDRYGLGDKATGAPADNRYTGYVATDVIDEHTIRIRFSKPNSDFLGILTHEVVAVVGAATLDLPTYDEQVQLKNIVGTGPYILKSYTPEESIVLERRDDYNWIPASSSVQGKAQFKTVVIRAVREVGLRAGAVASGQVQLARGIQPSDEAALVAGGYSIFSAQARQATTATYIALRALVPEQKAVLGDVRVREALQLAFDRQALVDAVLSPSYQPANNLWNKYTPGYENVSAELLRYDQTRANQLLDEAGWTKRDDDGFRVKDGNRLAISIVAQSSSVAIRPTFEYIETHWRQIGVQLLNYAGDDTAWNAGLTDLKYSGFSTRNQPVRALTSLPLRAHLEGDKDLAVLTKAAISARTAEESAKTLAAWGRYLIEKRYVLIIYDEVQVHAGAKGLTLEFTAGTSPIFRTALLHRGQNKL